MTMSSAGLVPQLSLLRAVQEATGQPPLRAIARLPGVSEIYRLTAHYFDRRGQDSVATLRCTRTRAHVEIFYRGAFGGKPLVHDVPDARVQALVAALRSAGFDRLADQEDLPEHDATDVWLIERAAGTFSHGVIVAPALATGAHAAVAQGIRTYLPEMLKQVR